MDAVFADTLKREYACGLLVVRVESLERRVVSLWGKAQWWPCAMVVVDPVGCWKNNTSLVLLVMGDLHTVYVFHVCLHFYKLWGFACLLVYIQCKCIFYKPWGCCIHLCVHCVCVKVGHVGVWGELVNHKRSLTYHPSSQGWAHECPTVGLFVLYRCSLLGLGFLPFFCSSATTLAT